MHISLLLHSFILTVLLFVSAQWSASSARAEDGINQGASSTKEWTLVNQDAMWERRAGLRVVELDGSLYLMGGRTPRPPGIPPLPGDSDIHGDVWRSDDYGATWTKILDTETPGHWPARAYFQAFRKGRHMYLLGGQNFRVSFNPACPPPFINCSPVIDSTDFFNDVWRSDNGIDWVEVTGGAGWEGRAGLSAVVFNNEIYVMAGSQSNDSSIVGGSPRTYFNDVWKSADGRDWVQLTDSAAWAPRAGAILKVKDDSMYLFGGEFGFTCEPLPFCDPPYFNDVWRSSDGVTWEVVTDSAAWSPRPGHHVAVIGDKFVLFGGFGLLANPIDMWVSTDGATWDLMSDTPWDATVPEQIKYDFDLLVVRDPASAGKAILTFGGDRETFDFSDTTQYLNVDNDVWRYGVRATAAFGSTASQVLSEGTPQQMLLEQNYPNPFNPSTTITYGLSKAVFVEIAIFNLLGQRVTTLVAGIEKEGYHSVTWNGMSVEGTPVPSGVYVYRMTAGEFTEVRKLMLMK
ncbi:MAG: T9SS type A sorting domain-containing protein [Ignavibacteria bacterium]|nr:T9SS type A sorting domain-containing protein [Ignavibacteria bacterium]